MRATTFLGLIVGIVLLVASFGLGVRERSSNRLAVEHALANRADDERGHIAEYFARARSIALITAHNPAFRDFYAEPGARLAKVQARGRALRQSEDGLAYLQHLYPTRIGETCFIDRTGPENARYVKGVRAPIGDLSPDESRNSFFAPTFRLRPGGVFQARPYVSPDTDEWVISNSTPVPGTGYPAAAMVHYEITVESFRQEAAALAGGDRILVVDAGTGDVVIDSSLRQGTHVPLGRPDDRRFSGLVHGASAGTGELGGHRIAYRRLPQTAHNQNDWFVVAVDPHPAGSLLSEFGWAPLGMAFTGLLLLLLAAVSARTSRRVLDAAARTDALTGIGNRRKLVEDLESACARAERGERFALVLYDLDGFKGYNDRFGHLPGDALLRRLAAKLAAAVKGSGEAYRLGGDEFCVIAPLRRDEQPETISALGADALTEGGEGFTVGASYGTVVVPDEAQGPADVLAAADLRMYACKHQGRASAARQTTDVLVSIQQARAPQLAPYISEVAELAPAIGRHLGLSDERLAVLEQAAELHDIGKMAIPDAVLEKPGPLTPDEWWLVREHTVVGERVLSSAPALHGVAPIVRSSHERVDGTGYPDGLAGDAIALEARIVAAADAFCAMTSERPYRKARDTEGALAELARCAGSQFDAAVVEALTAVVREAAGSQHRAA